ncbi:MAG: hypothetical protein IKL73_04525 [Lachnospiraceae bacterium]|nr:hypothetical protein [Lachnospiraceae bacterium]
MKKKVTKRLVALLLVISMMIPVINYYKKPITVQGKSSKSEVVEKDLKQAEKQDKKDKENKRLKANIKGNKYRKNEKIKISYDKEEILDYRIETDGVEVETISDENMEFNIMPSKEFGKLDIYANYGEGEDVKSTIYTYKNGDNVYVSDLSKDSAWYACMEEKYNNGEITLEEMEDEYSKFCADLIECEISVQEETESVAEVTAYSTMQRATTYATDRRTTVSARVCWTQKEGKPLYMRQTKVELRDKETVGSRLIATAYTDDNGIVNFAFDNPDKLTELENGGYDIFLRIYATSYTFEVGTGWHIGNYYYDSLVEWNVETGSNTDLVIRVPYNEDVNSIKAFYVEQGMVLAQRFAMEMGMQTNNFIHVAYPGEDFDTKLLEEIEESAFCWGDIEENCFAVIGLKLFNDIDTLTHEYGHFVECSMGNYGSDLLEIIINGPDHRSDTDHFSDKDSKVFAMELTWSESWATVFGELAQQYYKDDYKVITGIADIDDDISDDKTYESYTFLPESGEAQEDAVTAFLWDLFDSGEYGYEPEDTMALGYERWWEYTTHQGTYTLTHFAKVIEEHYPKDRSAIGSIMGMHQIAASDVQIDNRWSVSKTVPPIISWRVNGSQAHPNNRFQIVFYDEDGNEIYKTFMMQMNCSNGTRYTYNISLYMWNEVINRFGDDFTINIAIKSYNWMLGYIDPITTGPYTSKWMPITLSDKEFMVKKTDRYIDKQIKLSKGEVCELYVTFETSGYKLFQAFGGYDTMIKVYSPSGTLLASNDDNGYSLNPLVNYYVTANTRYKIQVRFYSSNIAGKTRLSITPAKGMLNSGKSSITSYEDILTINAQSYSIDTTMEKDYVKVVVFKPTVSGKYIFKTESDLDTYIYVVDPRSTGPLSQKDYNDDYSDDDCDAGVIKELQANVPYYIVYSLFNPSYETDERLKLLISKK